MSRDPTKLTSKQELFVQGLISGKSQRIAYIGAGYKTEGKKNEYIDIRASELFKNSKVLVRFNELNSKVIEKAEKNTQISFEWIVNEWIKLKMDATEDKNYTGRAKALTELTTLFNYYPKEDKNSNEETKKIDAAIDKLSDKLNKRFGK